jgi:nitrogen regulatory protein PII
MYMVLLVLDDPDRLNEVLEAWEKAGVGGATIIESTGLHRVRRQFLPMRYVSALVDKEENHLTLLVMVEDEARVQACLAAVEGVVGDLSGPNTGIFTAWPLSVIKGLPKRGV